MSNLEKGMVGTTRPAHADSGAAEGAVEFGTGVILGTADDQYKQADGTDSVFQGIAQYSRSGSVDDGTYDDEDAMRVLREGVIFAEISSNASSGASKGDTVYIDVNGDVITDADVTTGSGGDYVIKLNDAEFKEGGDAGDIVMIELNSATDHETVEIA